MVDHENEEHIGLVYHVAQNLANNNENCIRAFGRDVSEYVGEGFLALQIAKKNFKSSLGFKFATYAVIVIKDRLLQAARKINATKKTSVPMEGIPETEVFTDPRWELTEEIETRLKCLDSRTRSILTMRFGLDGSDCLTLEKIGEKLNLTRERIRQIERLGLKKLRGTVKA